MKNDFTIKSWAYCDKGNSVMKENVFIFNSMKSLLEYIQQNKECLFKGEDKLYYGEYYVDIEFELEETDIQAYIEEYISNVVKYENEEVNAGDFKANQEEIKPIDFESLLLREKDKKKVIYGLFDSILDINLPVIQKIVGEYYKVKIINKLSGGNILYIREANELGARNCYIKYENVNPHKTLQELTREEIEDYLKRIVIGFVMEYDK